MRLRVTGRRGKSIFRGDFPNTAMVLMDRSFPSFPSSTQFESLLPLNPLLLFPSPTSTPSPPYNHLLFNVIVSPAYIKVPGLPSYPDSTWSMILFHYTWPTSIPIVRIRGCPAKSAVMHHYVRHPLLDLVLSSIHVHIHAFFFLQYV